MTLKKCFSLSDTDSFAIRSNSALSSSEICQTPSTIPNFLFAISQSLNVVLQIYEIIEIQVKRIPIDKHLARLDHPEAFTHSENRSVLFILSPPNRRMPDRYERIMRKPFETEPEGVRISPAGTRNDTDTLTLPPRCK